MRLLGFVIAVFLFLPIICNAQTGRQANRPQTPSPPFPYRAEEVAYRNQNDNVGIAGTLTFPQSGGPFPAVILISGSGQQDRDETLYGHKPFAVLADYLARLGIASLRYDDRGVGGTDGDVLQATSEDFARDTLAGLGYLLSRPEIDSNRIGLMGHSEGGLIAPMVANRSSAVSFLVLLAGPGEPGAKIIDDQATLIGRAQGAPEDYLRFASDERNRIIHVAIHEPDQTIAKQKIKAIVDDTRWMLSEAQRKALAAEFEVYLTPWFRFFLEYDPATALRNVTIPLLALNGTKDLQVPHESNLAAIEAALQESGNQNFSVQAMLGLNHLFQTANTGAISEYETIEETFSPSALKIIGDWILLTIQPTVIEHWARHGETHHRGQAL